MLAFMAYDRVGCLASKVLAKMDVRRRDSLSAKPAKYALLNKQTSCAGAPRRTKTGWCGKERWVLHQRGSLLEWFCRYLYLFFFPTLYWYCFSQPSFCASLNSAAVATFRAILDAEVFLLRLVLPSAVLVQRSHSQHDMRMGIVPVCIMDRHVCAHALLNAFVYRLFPVPRLNPLSPCARYFFIQFFTVVFLAPIASVRLWVDPIPAR